MIPPGSGGAKVTANKAKANEQLNKNAAASSSTQAKDGKPPTAPSPASGAATEANTSTLELAEQLNLETKRKYVKGDKVGSGTYADVFLGRERAKPTAMVAIKKIKINPDWQDGLAMDAIREIKHLQELRHPNIISLEAVFSSKNQNLNLVLEFLPLGDMEQLIKDVEHVHYGPADMKAWMGMLCRGVWFCHENFVLHRDIKPNNLLIAADGEVKLADFGFARGFADPYQNMSTNVITRWYRPPELFFEAKHYSGAVDIWSVGTVFAELIKRRPYLAGETDSHQLHLICEWVGTPTEENWPGVTKLPLYESATKNQPVQPRPYYQREFGAVGQDGVDLLMAMLKLNPKARISAREVLRHKYWMAVPKPTAKRNLPKKGGANGAGGAAGIKKMGDDLKRPGGEIDGQRADKVARKLDFGSMKK